MKLDIVHTKHSRVCSENIEVHYQRITAKKYGKMNENIAHLACN